MTADGAGRVHRHHHVGDQHRRSGRELFGQNQKLTDANGREHADHNMANMWMNSGLSIMGDIKPGNAIQVKIAFDVPPGTQATELELHDSMFSGGIHVRLV